MAGTRVRRSSVWACIRGPTTRTAVGAYRTPLHTACGCGCGPQSARVACRGRRTEAAIGPQRSAAPRRPRPVLVDAGNFGGCVARPRRRWQWSLRWPRPTSSHERGGADSHYAEPSASRARGGGPLRSQPPLRSPSPCYVRAAPQLAERSHDRLRSVSAPGGPGRAEGPSAKVARGATGREPTSTWCRVCEREAQVERRDARGSMLPREARAWAQDIVRLPREG